MSGERVREILPQIYSSGKFTLKGKLRRLLNDNVWYTCVAIRKLEEILAYQEDPYAKYYEPLGLEREEYLEHKEANYCIISLKDSKGELINFPSLYLESFPDGNGIKYSVIGLAFDLGALPVEFDTEELERELRDIIFNRLGVRSRSRVLTLSNVKILSHEDHLKVESARKRQIQDPSINPHYELKELRKEIKKEKELNKSLSDLIIRYEEAIKEGRLLLNPNPPSP